MEEVSQEIFNESQAQVPVRTGVLKASGHVDPPSILGNDIEVNIGYGGAAAQYALFVHENLQAHHTPPTKAKYLEDPMADALSRLSARLQDRMEGAIVGQYPGSPALGQQAQMTAETNAAHVTRSAHSPAMTRADVERALSLMSRVGARSVRKGM
jgi:hypothetical protein